MQYPKYQKFHSIVLAPLCIQSDDCRSHRQIQLSIVGSWVCAIHYGDVIMGAMEPQITSLPIVYLTGYSGEDERKHQSSASLAFVRGIHRGPVNSPHKWTVTRKMFPFDDVIMPRGLFISGWSWFSLTMGMLRVVFEIIVGAAQTCPCCVNITVSRMADWLFMLFIVAQQVQFQR